MWVRFFLFLKGYLKVKITGFSPERFFNLCSNHDILLWNMEKHNEQYIFCISIKGFFQIKPLVKKTKTKVVILNKYGLPFLLPSIWKKKFFLIGFVICILFLLYTEQCIWAVDFVGNQKITDDMLYDFLEKKNITYGVKKKDIVIAELEEKIREYYEATTWVAVEIIGTKLQISLKESEFSEYVNKEDFLAADLYASEEGTIISILLRKGIAQVKVGESVKAGDILVSGRIPIFGDDQIAYKYNYCVSDADIIVKNVITYKDSVALKYDKNTDTGLQKEYYFAEIFGKHYSFGYYNPYEQFRIFSQTEQLKLFESFYFPIKYGKTIIYETKNTKFKRTDNEGKQILMSQFEHFIKTLEEKGVQIIENNVKIEKIGESMVAHGDLGITVRTGIQKEIDVESEIQIDLE